MASSSSCLSNISIISGPVEGDCGCKISIFHSIFRMGEEDIKLHIRRVVPTYQGQEEIPEEIIPVFRQSGFY